MGGLLNRLTRRKSYLSMTHFLKNLCEYFTGPATGYSMPDYRKAKVLVSIHLFILSVGLSLFIVSVGIEENQDVYFLPGLLLVLLSLFFFRKYRNLAICGNLLSTAWVISIIPAVESTGGLFSDNLLWLGIAPLLAILFGNRRYGYLWLLLLSAYTLYLGQTTSAADIANRVDLLEETSYYLISYISLFVVTTLVTIIFETGQRQIISIYIQQQGELKQKQKRIKRQVRELEKAKEELQHSNQLLTQFAYTASHDLKEPLRMIGMYTGLIRRKLNTQLDADTEEYMGYVVDGIDRMETMLTDLLEYSRVGRIEMPSMGVDLNDTLFMVINNLGASLQEHKGAIYSTHLPVVTAPPLLMNQLFQNIISNGIKFRKPSHEPEVHIQCAEVEGGYRFSISDNGIGIAEKDQDRVFNIFERLHTQQQYRGSGIGLATCQRIIETLHGNIWLQSEPGVGTTFYFTLPRKENSLTDTTSCTQPNSIVTEPVAA